MTRIRYAVALLLLVASPAMALKITIVNKDGLNEGFNDPTPVAPVGGNSGTTLGQQRLIAFQHAANLWGALLEGSVEVKVEASFDPLTCGSDGVTLGSAGSTTIHANFGAGESDTWYSAALANQLAGRDLNGDRAEIVARFNSSLDGTSTCNNNRWYLGLDGRKATGETDLVIVLLHELGHGLGFQTFTSSSGSFNSNRPDIFAKHILDNTIGLRWHQMTVEQRQLSALNDGNLVWDGERVRGEAASFLAPAEIVEIQQPSSIAGRYRFGTASFAGPITVAGATATVVEARDAANSSGQSERDACTTLTNASAVAGRIALIDRGNCTFALKSKNAQDAGAIAVIIVDNQACPPETGCPSPVSMSGDDLGIRIPVVSVTQDDGTKIRSNLPSVVASIRADPSQRSGADNQGRVRLYAPSSFEQGSSISHFDRVARPNLLMEPSISSDLKHGVDLTLPLFLEIGWKPTGVAALSATMTDSISIRTSEAVVTYSAVITNTGGADAVNVVFSLTPDPKSTLMTSSVTTSRGEVRKGNSTGETVVEVATGAVAPGASATVTFAVRVPLTSLPTSLSAQGFVSSDNAASVPTDDPHTTVANDPTVTNLASDRRRGARR